MTDHRTALARIPETKLARLANRSTWAGGTRLAGHLALIAATGTLIAADLPLWWVLLPVHGILLTFLFTLEHECTHQTPFAQGWLSDAVGQICGLVLILPFTWFRYFHLAHHRHTNDPEKDPERANPKPDSWAALMIYVSGWGYWSAVTRQLVINALGRAEAPYLPAKALPRMTAEARWMLGAYAIAASTLIWSPLLIWLWIVPMLLGQPFLRLYLMAEHGRCPAVANMFENTRTTYTNRAIRYIAWNMPYHAEHHAAPHIPFHQLPALNAYLKDDLRHTADGYLAFTKDTLARL
jgi:fatty acid desaturase